MANGHEVIVLDDLSSGTLQNLRQHQGEPNFHFIKGDIRNTKVVKDVMADVEAVFHQAAIVSVPFSFKNPTITHEVNVSGTLNLLRASLDRGVKRFLYASTSAVYGEATKLPLVEDAELEPLSPYAESKLVAETHCLDFYKTYGLETACLRYFNVYGPRQVPGPYAGVIIQFLDRLRSGRRPIIYGDGFQTRDFIYISDVIDATMLASTIKKAAGEVFNIGTGKATTINKLCEILLQITNNPGIKPVYANPRPGDIRRSQADISKARRILNYRPTISLEEGLRKFVGIM
jgi:nucleoside-diphosphate-sugar epimerase